MELSAEKKLSVPPKKNTWRRDWKMNKWLYMLAIPIFLYFFIFHYGRMTGFKDACEAKSLPYEMFISDWGNHYDEVCRNTRRIIDLLDEKYSSHKGVFVSNDTHANIFLNLLLRKHGKLPEDYSLVGFDNSVVSAEAAYPISTIGQQTDMIAEQAMELLLMQMKAQNSGAPADTAPPVHRIIPPLVIVRETTK